MDERNFHLILKKRKFSMIALAGALLFYFCLPLSLIFIPDLMNRPSFIFDISWAWLYAFMQIPMTWFFCGLYHFKSNKIERQLEGVEQEGVL